ncbi:hypothetical protein ACJX0J_024894, partial [Zea mays]
FAQLRSFLVANLWGYGLCGVICLKTEVAQPSKEGYCTKTKLGAVQWDTDVREEIEEDFSPFPMWTEEIISVLFGPSDICVIKRGAELEVSVDPKETYERGNCFTPPLVMLLKLNLLGYCTKIISVLFGPSDICVIKRGAELE